MTAYEKVKQDLINTPKTWLITGVAGFIGSNLLEALLLLNQNIVGLDNFATGHQHNLDDVKQSVSPEQWSRFVFIEGDICNLKGCQKALGVSSESQMATGSEIDYVLHQAALVSVQQAEVKSFTYAASSSAYGEQLALPKVEGAISMQLEL